MNDNIAFKAKCFIRFSTEELVEKLYRIGGRPGKGFWYSDNLTLLVADIDKFYCLDDENDNSLILTSKGYIDCGRNEDLFLALANMGSGKNEFYTCIHEHITGNMNVYQIGDMLRCDVDKANINNSLPSWRLSTIKEVISKFDNSTTIPPIPQNKLEYILCAAIKRKEPLTCEPYYNNDITKIEIGYRHHDIFARFGKDVSSSPKDQGFYTSKGRFVGREEGMKIAYEAGQVNYHQAFKKNGKFNILYSEDLY